MGGDEVIKTFSDIGIFIQNRGEGECTTIVFARVPFTLAPALMASLVISMKRVKIIHVNHILS